MEMVRCVFDHGFYIILHHVDNRRNLHPRFLEFVSTWRDFVQPNHEICIHVVKPDPYRGYLQREVLADVIISQGH